MIRQARSEAGMTQSTLARAAGTPQPAVAPPGDVLNGVEAPSERRYGCTSEPVGAEVEADARSLSKSAISRTFIERTREALGELMARRLDDVRLAVLMLDGIELKGRTNVVALGITSDGVKIPLGLWEGSTENAAVATSLLSDLVERGLDTTQGVLCVLDGSKALRRAVRDVLGEAAPVQRCVRHKERNVLDHLPERDRALVRRRLRAAWDDTDHGRALGRLEQLAAELERSHPGAAASLREGMAETLTLTRLGISGQLRRTLASTNPIESMIECVRRTSRKREALVLGRDGPALDRRRDARGRAPVPAHHRLPAARQAGRCDRARARPAGDDRGGGYPRQCVVSARDRCRSSTTSGTSSGNVTPVSSSETVHRRRWMAVSWDCPLDSASFG